MRRTVKVKALSTRVPLRKTAKIASGTTRRPFPAWIEADEGTVAFPAKAGATPRVRDGLVLRAVSKKKSNLSKGSSHAGSGR